MRKTTLVIITGAATAAVILITQAFWHHSQAPRGRGIAKIQKLSAPQASDATEAARGLFDAMSNGDWNTIRQYWPPNVPKGKSMDEIFTPQIKDYVSGMTVVSLSAPYKQGQMVLVPYLVQWKDGNTQSNNLRLAKARDGHWIWEGGF